jgi:biotin synthase
VGDGDPLRARFGPPGDRPVTREEILSWLREGDGARLEGLWERADRVRRETVGDAVHLRGLVEISNHCVRRCAYCGISAENREIARYRMGEGEVLACAEMAARLGYGTVVLQAGEDYGLGREWVAGVVGRIKDGTGLAVTLSLGERPTEDLAAWREAGADRYLLRFETSDAALYERVHPSLPGRRSDRFAQLRTLRGLGYEVGSGIMLGIPGQSYESVARDLELFRDLDLDMIGVGPFIPHPATPLGHTCIGAAGESPLIPGPPEDQVPNTEAMTYRAVALARILRPDANIPSTTALATLNQSSGRELGLARGANVVMPNLTPAPYRVLYEIYPGKACVSETAEACNSCLRRRIESMGRSVGQGPGGRRRPEP